MNTGLILFFVVGLSGMIAHQAKKWFRDNDGDVKSFVEFLRAHPGYTIGALVGYAAAVAALMQLGIDDPTSTEALATSFLAGYSSDSALNRSPSRSDYYSRSRRPATSWRGNRDEYRPPMDYPTDRPDEDRYDE